MMLRIEYRKKICSCYAIIKVCGFRVNRHLNHRNHLPLDIIWDVVESTALGNSKLLGYILNKLDSETNDRDLPFFETCTRDATA